MTVHTNILRVFAHVNQQLELEHLCQAFRLKRQIQMPVEIYTVQSLLSKLLGTIKKHLDKVKIQIIEIDK